MVAQFACKVSKKVLLFMEVGESIDISDLPGRIVHCSVRCRRNVTKYTGSFKFTNVNRREDAFYCFPGNGEGG